MRPNSHDNKTRADPAHDGGCESASPAHVHLVSSMLCRACAPSPCCLPAHQEAMCSVFGLTLSEGTCGAGGTLHLNLACCAGCRAHGAAVSRPLCWNAGHERAWQHPCCACCGLPCSCPGSWQDSCPECGAPTEPAEPRRPRLGLAAAAAATARGSGMCLLRACCAWSA